MHRRFALHRLSSRSSPTCRQENALTSCSAEQPRPQNQLRVHLPASPAPLVPSSGALPIGWTRLLGTTSLLLVGSRCAGTGIIGLLTPGHNHVLQGKQKKIENKYSIITIASGDRGNNWSNRSLPWGRGGFLSRVGSPSRAGWSPRGLADAFCQGSAAGAGVPGCLGTGRSFPRLDWERFKEETEE